MEKISRTQLQEITTSANEAKVQSVAAEIYKRVIEAAKSGKARAEFKYMSEGIDLSTRDVQSIVSILVPIFPDVSIIPDFSSKILISWM